MSSCDGTQQRTIRGDVGRPTGVHTLKLCTSTYMQRDWKSLWSHHYIHETVEPRIAGTARDELILLHETVGYLAANLYEMSIRLNDMGSSNQFVYTSYTLGLWTYRWWHLIQNKARAVIDTLQDVPRAQEMRHEIHCRCDFCQRMEEEASSFLYSQVIPYLTSLRYDDDIGERKLEVNRKRPVGQYVATRQLFEPGYDAWQNEKPFHFSTENGQLFNKHLQMCSICMRKELYYLKNAVQTMNMVRHRPVFQSLRAVLRDAYEAFPVHREECGGAKSFAVVQKVCETQEKVIEVAKTALHATPTSSEIRPRQPTRFFTACVHHTEAEAIIKAREITEHFANILERVAVINETVIDRAKQAQVEQLKLFQTEGVIVGTGLILTTAASSISLVVNVEPRDAQHARLVASTFELFLCSALLSLWASLLYLVSAVRLMHPFSRPYIRSEALWRWQLVYILHYDTLTRTVLAMSFMTLLSGFVSYAQVYRVVHIDKTRPKQVNPDADVSSLVYSDDVQHIFWVPVAVTILALLHLVGRFLWHYIWEYAYGWRVWRRYKAAVEGNDTVEENRFRDRHVFIEVLYFFEKNHIASIKAAARRAKAFFRPKNKREGEGDP